MFIYYFFILLVAILFFYLMFLFKNSIFLGAKLLIFFLVLWVFFISALFPGVVSFFSPIIAVGLTVFFAVSGGLVIYSVFSLGLLRRGRQKVALLLLPPPKKEEYLLLQAVTSKNEHEEELLLPTGLELETLIEKAFEAKEEKNYAASADLFAKALNFTENDSLKGMIYTELVFLYKEMGMYEEGAQMLEEFISHNASSFSPSLRSHFKRLVSYLKELNELLIKAGHPNLPFSKVPQLIKIRAEQLLKE